MKKKQTAAMLLAMSMAIGSLTACGSGSGSGDTTAAPSGTETTAADGQTQTEAKSADGGKNASGETATITFSWWGSQDRADRTNQAVELFMEKNPDIKVETSFYPWDSYYENLSISATSGNMPDVFQYFVGAADGRQFATQGLVEPLDSYIEQGIINTSDIADSLLQTGMDGGKTYGLALGANVKCMAVDPEIYEKAGLTIPEVAYDSWEALGTDLEKIKEVTGAYGADDPFDMNYTFPYFCRQYGEIQFDPESENSIGFSEATYEKYYQLKTSWIEQGLIPPYDVSQGANGLEDSQLVKGKAGVKTCYSSEYKTLADAAGKELKLILLPGPDTDKGTDIRPGQHVSMSSQSKNKEAAARLIDFLINDIDCNKILNAERGMPASDKVRAALMGGFDENQKKMAEIMDLASEHSSAGDLMPKGNATEMYDLFVDLDEQIIYGTTDPKAAYEELQAAGQ